MKKIISVSVMIMVFVFVSVSLAGVLKIDLKENIQKVEYVEIKTNKSLFRIYPCGKIEKKTWKEIHENEDNTLIWSATTVLEDNTLYLKLND